MKGATPVLLKVLLFQLSGRHHHDFTPNFISDSSSCISELSNELSFVSDWPKQSKRLTENLGICLFSFGTVHPI